MEIYTQDKVKYKLSNDFITQSGLLAELEELGLKDDGPITVPFTKKDMDIFMFNLENKQKAMEDYFDIHEKKVEPPMTLERWTSEQGAAIHKNMFPRLLENLQIKLPPKPYKIFTENLICFQDEHCKKMDQLMSAAYFDVLVNKAVINLEFLSNKAHSIWDGAEDERDCPVCTAFYFYLNHRDIKTLETYGCIYKDRPQKYRIRNI